MKMNKFQLCHLLFNTFVLAIALQMQPRSTLVDVHSFNKAQKMNAQS